MGNGPDPRLLPQTRTLLPPNGRRLMKRSNKCSKSVKTHARPRPIHHHKYTTSRKRRLCGMIHIIWPMGVVSCRLRIPCSMCVTRRSSPLATSIDQLAFGHRFTAHYSRRTRPSSAPCSNYHRATMMSMEGLTQIPYTSMERP